MAPIVQHCADSAVMHAAHHRITGTQGAFSYQDGGDGASAGGAGATGSDGAQTGVDIEDVGGNAGGGGGATGRIAIMSKPDGLVDEGMSSPDYAALLY